MAVVRAAQPAWICLGGDRSRPAASPKRFAEHAPSAHRRGRPAIGGPAGRERANRRAVAAPSGSNSSHRSYQPPTYRTQPNQPVRCPPLAEKPTSRHTSEVINGKSSRSSVPSESSAALLIQPAAFTRHNRSIMDVRNCPPHAAEGTVSRILTESSATSTSGHDNLACRVAISSACLQHRRLLQSSPAIGRQKPGKT